MYVTGRQRIVANRYTKAGCRPGWCIPAIRCSLLHELGWRRFLGFNLIGTGLIVSALIHPIYLATLVIMATDPLTLWGDGGAFAAMVIGVNLFNLFAGYFAMAALATRTLALRGNRHQAWPLVLLPIYWLLMSVASYRALVQLVVRPHKWEKTPHRGRHHAAEPHSVR